MKVKLPDLESALKDSWSRETSSDPANWSEENPAWGQCAVTALIVNDYLGGEIVWALARLPNGKEASHYFNKIDNEDFLACPVDLTRTQFPQGTYIPQGIQKTKNFPTTRDYILSYKQTVERYNLLKCKVNSSLERAL